MNQLKPIVGSVNIPFSRERYERSDNKAKQWVVDYLSTQGHTILDIDEDFSVDIKSKMDYTNFFSEAEIKYGWKGDWNPNWKRYVFHIANINLSMQSVTRECYTSTSYDQT